VSGAVGTRSLITFKTTKGSVGMTGKNVIPNGRKVSGAVGARFLVTFKKTKGSVGMTGESE